MSVFVTGATGWIGSAAVDELLAIKLEAKDAAVLRGDLDYPDSSRRGATEGVVLLVDGHYPALAVGVPRRGRRRGPHKDEPRNS